MKKTTCVFGWKETTYNKDQHANNLRRIHKNSIRRASGTQPLSRMHPDHPVRNPVILLEAFSGTQKFVP